MTLTRDPDPVSAVLAGRGRRLGRLARRVRQRLRWRDPSKTTSGGVDVISIRDGLVQRKDTYLDLAAYQRQGLPWLNPK